MDDTARLTEEYNNSYKILKRGFVLGKNITQASKLNKRYILKRKLIQIRYNQKHRRPSSKGMHYVQTLQLHIFC